MCALLSFFRPNPTKQATTEDDDDVPELIENFEEPLKEEEEEEDESALNLSQSELSALNTMMLRKKFYEYADNNPRIMQAASYISTNVAMDTTPIELTSENAAELLISEAPIGEMGVDNTPCSQDNTIQLITTTKSEKVNAAIIKYFLKQNEIDNNKDTKDNSFLSSLKYFLGCYVYENRFFSNQAFIDNSQRFASTVLPLIPIVSRGNIMFKGAIVNLTGNLVNTISPLISYITILDLILYELFPHDIYDILGSRVDITGDVLNVPHKQLFLDNCSIVFKVLFELTNAYLFYLTQTPINAEKQTTALLLIFVRIFSKLLICGINEKLALMGALLRFIKQYSEKPAFLEKEETEFKRQVNARLITLEESKSSYATIPDFNAFLSTATTLSFGLKIGYQLCFESIHDVLIKQFGQIVDVTATTITENVQTQIFNKRKDIFDGVKQIILLEKTQMITEHNFLIFPAIRILRKVLIQAFDGEDNFNTFLKLYNKNDSSQLIKPSTILDDILNVIGFNKYLGEKRHNVKKLENTINCIEKILINVLKYMNESGILGQEYASITIYTTYLLQSNSKMKYVYIVLLMQLIDFIGSMNMEDFFEQSRNAQQALDAKQKAEHDEAARKAAQEAARKAAQEAARKAAQEADEELEARNAWMGKMGGASKKRTLKGYKNKTRKHKIRKHKTRKHKTRKHKKINRK
jgi:hypothetical protein